jgi:hypothetical protein
MSGDFKFKDGVSYTLNIFNDSHIDISCDVFGHRNKLFRRI